MKKTIIQIQVSNLSRYPIDIVWENAKDLEHVGFLHGRTNRFFELLHAEPDSSSQHEYGLMIFRTLRRFHIFSFDTFGFRKIVAEHNIHQMEYIPILRTTIALNSVLRPNPDPQFPTLMLDEVIMEVPFYLAPFKGYFERALKRHTAIQCAEDEPFRERRQLLKKKGIHFPFSIFNLSQFSHLTGLFNESVKVK